MPTPPFILDLRRQIGTAPLWLMGANAVVLRGAPASEVLLVRRADNGQWSPISGIVDPGEHPSVTAVREALEEASVVIEVQRLLWVVVSEPVTYANGDRCQYVDHGFLARWVEGEAAVGDEESTQVGWFPVDALPSPRQPGLDEMIAVAVGEPGPVLFEL